MGLKHFESERIPVNHLRPQPNLPGFDFRGKICGGEHDDADAELRTEFPNQGDDVIGVTIRETMPDHDHSRTLP